MKLNKVTIENSELFLKEIENNFPLNERRDNESELSLFKNKAFMPQYIEENGKKVGLFVLWQLSNFVFVEHFAIFDEFKNKGLGTKALEVLKNNYKSIVLEAELPSTEIAKRRISFYERNGFSVCQSEYYQPPYRKGDNPTRLNVLYCSNSFDFDLVKQELYSKVYNYMGE